MMKGMKYARYLLFALIITLMFYAGCKDDDDDNHNGDGSDNLVGTWNGTFYQTLPAPDTDNSASMTIIYQDAEGFVGTATFFSTTYNLSGSIEEGTGDIGMYLMPMTSGVNIAIAASLSDETLSGDWSDADNLIPTVYGTFSVTRQ